MKQISLFFSVQVLRRKSGVYILKIPQGDNEWNSKRRKDIKGENPKKNISSLCISKHKLTKSMDEIITSLFLQKLFEAYHNSGIQSNQKFLKRVSYNDQFSKNESLKFDKTLRTC